MVGERSNQRRAARVIRGDRGVRVPASDRRRDDSSGQCALCGVDGPLCRSHLVPKSIHGSGGTIGLHHSLNVVVSEQTSTWRYLLCPKCEGYLAEAERHVGEAIRALRDFFSGIEAETGLQFFCRTLNARLFKRFMLGNLFRLSYDNVTHDPVAERGLDEVERENFRHWILADDYTDERLALAVSVITVDGSPAPFTDLLINNFTRHEGGRFASDVVLGAFAWSILYALVEEDFEGMTMGTDDGPIPFTFLDWRDSTSVRGFIEAHRQAPPHMWENGINPLATLDQPFWDGKR
jgi:hypothetical protein